jgi:CBS domain-containing protein
MKARDIMVAPVITAKPQSSIKEVARKLVEKRISALPVVDNDGRLVGLVSEGDLMHRAEAGTERRRSWWLRLISSDEALARDYIEAHTHKIADVMSRDVITAAPDTPLGEIAMLMEQNAVKRIPIVNDNGELIGVVTRANLVQAIATAPPELEIPASDTAIRDRLMSELKAKPWAHTDLLTVTVNNGIVSLWGIARSDTERKAIRILAEETPGVVAVNDNIAPRPYCGLDG